MATNIDSRQVVNRSALAAIGSGTNATLDTIFPLINTQFANATSAATASVIMKRDANANTQVNNLIESAISIATAAGTTTLTVASAHFQQFTGTTTQTVVLPDATTLIVGTSFYITNRSTGYVTVNKNGGTLVQSLAPNSQAIVTVTNISTAAGTWDSSYSVSGPNPFTQTTVITDATTTGSNTTLTAADILNGVVRLTNASLVSVSGIPAGVAGQVITLENQTGNSITINNQETTATAANRIFTGSGGAASMPSNATFSFVYDAVVSRWMLVGGTGSGSGSGSKNYLSVYTASTSSGVPNTGNGNAELGSTTGWALGTTGTLTNGLPTGTPTFGSGASGNLSFGTVSSGQLAGSYSFSYVSSAATTAGNMVASNAFFIDAEDQGKVLTFKMYYSVPTNPANGNFSGTSSNSFALAVYDVTNSAWVPVAGAFAMTQNAGVGIATGTFQTAINVTQLRFVLYNVNASAGAITLYLDDISVGPQTAPIGAVVTDWQVYTPTVTGFGTITSSTFYWRRVGDSIELNAKFQAGTPTAVAATVTLPGGLTIDTTKINSTIAVVGLMGYNQNSAGSYYVLATGANNFVNFGVSSNGTAGLTANTGSNISITSGTLSYTALIPVTGWSSNVQMSSDTDTRIVAAVANKNSAQSIANSSFTVVTSYTGKSVDTHGAFNTSTGVFTVPVTGDYQVTVSLAFAVSGGGATRAVAIRKNTSQVAYGQGPGSAGATISEGTTQIIACVAGDTISMAVYQDSGGSLNTHIDDAINFISILRLSGPSVIAASESVNAGANSTSGQAVSSSTIIIFNNKDYDTHNAYNTSTGLYTVPISGKYRISSTILFTGSSNSVGTTFNFELNKNASLIRFLDIFPVQTTSSITPGLNGTTTLNLLAGDTISVSCSTNNGSKNLNTAAATNYLNIERIGN